MIKAFLLGFVAMSVLMGSAIASERKAPGLRNSDAIDVSAARRKRARSSKEGPLVMSGMLAGYSPRHSRVTADKCVPVKIRVR